MHNHRLRKANKKHRCMGCGEIIEKGKKYHREWGISDGDFWDWKLCELCYEYVQANKSEVFINGFCENANVIGELRMDSEQLAGYK